MRALALVAACALSACASTYAANPNDPVDMAGALGDRGRQYVGMAGVCDEAVGGGYSSRMTHVVAQEQARLGVLRGLVSRAYRGQPNQALRAHMEQQMAAHNLTAAAFCDAVVRQAQADLTQRANHVLALSEPALTLAAARDRGWIE